MARCNRCKTQFRTPPGEEQDHPCPACGWEPDRRTLREQTEAKWTGSPFCVDVWGDSGPIAEALDELCGALDLPLGVQNAPALRRAIERAAGCLDAAWSIHCDMRPGEQTVARRATL